MNTAEALCFSSVAYPAQTRRLKVSGHNEPPITDEVGKAYGIDPKTQTLATVDEMWALAPTQHGNDIVQLAPLANAVVAYEANGFTGIDEAVIAKISAPVSVSIFRNITAVMHFTLAKRGKIVRQFDPLMYDDGGLPLPEEAGMGFGLDYPVASAFALAQRLTAIEISKDWLLETRRPTFHRS